MPFPWVENRLTDLGDNNLSFIETSALDASNVELAFQNILTGKMGDHSLVFTATKDYQKSTVSFLARLWTKASKVRAPLAVVSRLI
jgi:hypothetical protein